MRHNFNTPLGDGSSTRPSTDIDDIKTQLEIAFSEATGFEVKFGKNLPKNISAASEYFPIAIIAMQVNRVAYAKIRSGRDSKFEVIQQYEKDKAELLELIELADNDTDAMYEKLHAFHRAINQRR